MMRIRQGLLDQAWAERARSAFLTLPRWASGTPVTVSNLATITLSNSHGTYRITIAITGRIRTTRVT